MGQEFSREPYEGPPRILQSRDLKGLADFIKSSMKNRPGPIINFMLGAGVSTSAGIPDFRSPETGIYANLARLNLPYPEAVFEINYFRANPIPFYTLARELLPGRFRPTITHSFLKLLQDKGLLGLCFTQNIDTLESLAGVDPRRIIEAHGSFADQHCIECGARYDTDKLRQHIKAGTVALCEQCGGLVKPDIVFFGESLPAKFFGAVPMIGSASILIVMGSSLTVHPFASLASRFPEELPRILINLDHVGDFGTRSDDVVLLGKTDDVVRELCRELGWEEELESLWKETEGVVIEFEPSVTTLAPAESEEERIEREVQEITDEVGKSLSLGGVPPKVAMGMDVSGPQAESTKEEVSAGGAPVLPQDKDRKEPEEPEKTVMPIQVQVGGVGSTKPKVTYIIGGKGGQLSGTEEETGIALDQAKQPDGEPINLQNIVEKKLLEQKL